MTIDEWDQQAGPPGNARLPPVPAWERIAAGAVAGIVVLFAFGCLVPLPVADWIITPAAWAISSLLPEQSHAHPQVTGAVAEALSGGVIGAAIAAIAPKLRPSRKAGGK
jgi:hypothetical protein